MAIKEVPKTAPFKVGVVSQIKSLVNIAKKGRQILRHQLVRIYFFLVPRFRPQLNDKNFGLNFIGYSQGDLGLGQAMRSMVFAALNASIPLVVRKFKARIPSNQTDRSLEKFFVSQCKYPVNIICANPDTLHYLPSWVRYSEWAKTYNIGYWFWELENFPVAWQYATSIVDEIWVAADYIADAMRKSGKKVVKIPFPLEFELPPESMNKEYFGLNSDEFTFIFSFDFLSVFEKKNPQATIKAFKQAFPVGDHTVRLILKTMNGSHYSPLIKNLEELIDQDPRIEIRDEYLTQNEMRGLIRSSNCYISLHRAEGLGLGLAEAMYLGKPTIATGYSGNTEFMNSTNSILVPYTLVPVPNGAYPNGKDQVWAEPDIAVAAEKMRQMVADSALREQLGKTAATYLREQHSYIKVGQAIRAQLEQIQCQTIINSVMSSHL
jgi:glycosyltransferase involved in cell wall biosynthesis